MCKPNSYIHCTLVFTLVFLFPAVAIAHPSNRTIAKPQDFTLTLKAKNKTIPLGERLTLSATIKNNSGKEVFLVPALSGSTLGMRYPDIQFIVTQPTDAPAPQIFGHCGNSNNIQVSDFVKVPKDGIFQLSSNSFNMPNNPFTIPGTYTIQITYSTDAKPKRWDGPWRLGLGSRLSKPKKHRQITNVPIMNLKSNVVTITVVAPPEKHRKRQRSLFSPSVRSGHRP